MSNLEKLWQKGKDFLGTKYPIISGGMTWVSNFELVKAVCDNGGFGVLAGGNMPVDLFEKEVDKCIAHIKTPFAVNLITIAPAYKTHLEILKNKKVPFVVFAGSFPRKAEVQLMKDSGKKVMTFASEKSIAEQMIRFGADALILEGSEAGGHIGHTSLIILLQAVLEEFRDKVPIFVAGGIVSGRIVAHMLLMGAAGVQLGTRFVMSEECTVHPAFKKVFMEARSREAVSTPQYDSRLPVVAVRCIRNRSMDEFGKLQLKLIKEMENGLSREKAQHEVESFWIGGLRKAVVDGDIENGSLMAGQSVGLIEDIKPMKKIFTDIVQEAEAELQRVKQLI